MNDKNRTTGARGFLFVAVPAVVALSLASWTMHGGEFLRYRWVGSVFLFALCLNTSDRISGRTAWFLGPVYKHSSRAEKLSVDALAILGALVALHALFF